MALAGLNYIRKFTKPLKGKNNMDNSLALRNHAYAVTMAIETMVEAMGMQAENQLRLSKGESNAYAEDDFVELVNRNGCHHNGVLSLNWF